MTAWQREFYRLFNDVELERIQEEGYDIESLENSLLSPKEVASMIKEDFAYV